MNVRVPGMQVLKYIRQCVRVYLCTIVHTLGRMHMDRSLRMYAGTYARPGCDCIEALPTRHGDCRPWCFVAELHVAAESTSCRVVWPSPAATQASHGYRTEIFSASGAQGDGTIVSVSLCVVSYTQKCPLTVQYGMGRMATWSLRMGARRRSL
jgi:hypothetical protein